MADMMLFAVENIPNVLPGDDLGALIRLRSEQHGRNAAGG